MIKKIKHLSGLANLGDNLVDVEYLNPEKVYIQLDTLRSKSYTLTVNEGDTVKAQQIIGVRNCGFYQENIISTVSGTVEKVEKRFANTGKIANTLIIANDMKNTIDDRVRRLSDEDVFKMSRDEIIKAMEENAVTGMGGAGFPTSVKYNTKDEIHTLVINAAECEPGLKADYMLMVLDPDTVFKGLKLALKASGAKKAVIGIKKTKVAAIKSLKEAISKYDLNCEIKEINDYYPAGWEVSLVKETTGIDIQGVIPATKGIIVSNVNTLRAIYLACANNETVDSVYVTVSGEVNTPSLVKTRVGVSVMELIAKAGGYKDDSNKVVVLGGPMMGTCILLDNAITNSLVTGVLVFNDANEKEENCVRCSTCIKSCPANLAPVQIMNRVKAGDVDGLAKLNVHACIGCGMCTYVCTSGIHVKEYIKKSKTMVKQ